MKRENLNQRQLAKEANMDVVQLNRIMKFKKKAGVKSLSALAKPLKCTVEDFYQAPAPEKERIKEVAPEVLAALRDIVREETRAREESRVREPTIPYEGDELVDTMMSEFPTAPRLKKLAALYVLTLDRRYLEEWKMEAIQSVQAAADIARASHDLQSEDEKLQQTPQGR